MNEDTWKVLRREEIFAARPYVVVARERIQTGAGLIVADYFQVELANFSVCVPQLPTGEIITLWQYKHGPRRHGLSFPGGYIEAGEAPATACGRELREETGYGPGRLELVGEYVDNGNQGGSHGHYYVALDCVAEAVPCVDDLEGGEIRILRPAAIDAALAAGLFSVVHDVAAWALARPRLA